MAVEDQSDREVDMNHKHNKQEEYEDHAEQFGQHESNQADNARRPSQAVRAKFITPLDPVIVTEDGGRLPAVPVEEAKKLNRLRDEAEGEQSLGSHSVGHGKDRECEGRPRGTSASKQDDDGDVPLQHATPPSRYVSKNDFLSESGTLN